MLKNKKILWPHTGAIFCGGKSQRMGRPKANIVLPDGITMIEHVYQIIKKVCSKVVLVGNIEVIPDSLKKLDCIKDRHKDCGPIGALEALLYSQMDLEYLIVPCDVPFISVELLSLLIHPSVKSPAVLSHKNDGQAFIEPLIARYPTKILSKVQESIEAKDFSMHHLVEKINAQKILVPDSLYTALENINEPKDIFRLKNILRA